MRNLVAALAVCTLGLALVVACGSTAAEIDPGADGGDGGTGPFGSADGSAAEGGRPLLPDGGFACLPGGETCCVNTDCCAGACVDGACAGADSDAGKSAACAAPGRDCTAHEDCCGGRCEPVTGQAGVKKCLDACRGEGVACTRAQDCCSLGCFGGKCAAQLCKLQSESCAADTDCCSGICDPGTKVCKIDLANSTCRPTGEVCGSGPQSGCCLSTKGDDLCHKDLDPKESRCGLPPTTCKGITAACATDAECCGGRCDPGTKKCAPACLPDGAACTACTTNGCVTQCGDCCSGGCVNGVCGAPPPGQATPGTPGAPKPLGTPCTDGAQCASGFCLGGFCDSPVR